MAEYFFTLSTNDQREALEYARDQMGRPAHLLEKDVWYGPNKASKDKAAHD